MENITPLKFKESFKGYNKDDVNNYIETLNNKFISIENEYKKIILAQNNEIEKSTKEPVSDPQPIVDELIEKNNECNKIINALRDNIEKLNNEKSELYLELQKVKVNLNELNEMLNNTDLIQQKADSYDKMSSQIGSMIIFANEKADEIITGANKQAEEITAIANEQVNELIEKTKTKIFEVSEKYINHCLTFETEIKNYLNDFIQIVKVKSDNIFIQINEEITNAGR